MNNAQRTLMALAVGALCLSSTARADSISITGWWSNAGSANNITLTNGVDYHNGNTYSFAESGGSGGFAVTDNGGASFQAWCVDIFHDFSFGNPATTTDTNESAGQIFALLGSSKATKIQTDLERLYEEAHTSIDSKSSTAQNSAAFQLAIWEIVNETASTKNISTESYNLGNGAFTVASSSTGYSTAESWLTALNNSSFEATPDYTVSFWSVNGNNNGAPPTWGAQDVAVFAPVPEPETYAMLMAGLGLMGAVARRRKQTSAA